MQLDCKRHHIAGVRVDSRCYKCTPLQEKKNPIDSPKSIGLSVRSGTQGSQSGGRLSLVTTTAGSHHATSEPVAQSGEPSTVGRSTARDSSAFGERSSQTVDATKLQQLGVTQGEIFLRHFGFAGPAGVEQFARALREGIRRAKAGAA